MVLDKQKFLKERYNIIKICIETTLDETYDFIDALRVNNPNDPAVKSLLSLANAHEELYRKFKEKIIDDDDFESIKTIIKHRYEIVQKKSQQLFQAIEEFTPIIEELNN